MIVFTVFWLICFFAPGTETQFSTVDYATLLGSAVLIVTIATIVFGFFSRQIVDIQFYNGEVILIRESGNVAYKGENYFKVIETPNRYILCISQKKYSAYNICRQIYTSTKNTSKGV